MKHVREFVKKHPKISAAIGAAAVAGAASYGVPPGTTQSVLRAIFGG